MKITVNVEGRTYIVDVHDAAARPVIAVVDGDRFEIWPEDATPSAPVVAQPLPAGPQSPAPAAPSSERSERVVTAPIPGVIVALNARVGQHVEEGQELCILEAMKMKNAIRATRAGAILVVSIAVGDHVRHGQTLFEFAD